MRSRARLFVVLLLWIGPVAAAPPTGPAKLKGGAAAVGLEKSRFAFGVRAVPHLVSTFGAGATGNLSAAFGRRFGGFTRALATAQELGDERLQKMPAAAQADLAGTLLSPGPFASRTDREAAGAAFVRVLTAHGSDAGHVLGTLARLGMPIASKRVFGRAIDHRKQVIVDGERAFIGGMNVGNEYRDVWHDVQAMVTGPAVADMQALVASRIRLKGGKLPRSLTRSIRDATRAADAAPAAEGAPTARVVAHDGVSDQHEKLLYLRAIDTSTKRILIENAYMADRDVVAHLARAAKRGVDVSLVLPSNSDVPILKLAQRASYSELLAAGVHIHEYVGANPDRPVMTHGKVAVFDDHLATIGSSNLDALSLQNNDEVNLWVRDPKLNDRLAKELFAEDFKVSHAVKDYVPTRMQKLEDKVLRAASSQL